MRQDSPENAADGGSDRKFAFTKTRLEALPVPERGRVYYRDAKTEGLALCVTPSGCRTFYFDKWDSGGHARHPLEQGRFPA